MKERNETLENVKKLKSEGMYAEALVLGGQMLSEDLYDPESYSLIGKIYYLMNDLDASLRYFLTSLHMELLHAKRERGESAAYLKESDEILSASKSLLVKHLEKNDLRRLMLLFGHTLIHIGHSLADDSIDSGRTLEIKEYKEIIAGTGTETSDKYGKMEQKFYLPLGLIFSLAVLDGKLTIKEAATEYFKKDVNELSKIYSETLAILKKIS